MLLGEPNVEGRNEPRLYRVVATGDMNTKYCSGNLRWRDTWGDL